MKTKIIFILSMFLLLIGTNQSYAQEINQDKNNYLVLSKNIKQLKPVLLTADELAEEDGKKYGEFYMVIFGSTVNEIPGNAKFEKLLKKAKAKNIRVFVCGMSLSKSNIDPEKLPDGLEVTGNAITYGLQLTKQGFITISI